MSDARSIGGSADREVRIGQLTCDYLDFLIDGGRPVKVLSDSFVLDWGLLP